MLIQFLLRKKKMKLYIPEMNSTTEAKGQDTVIQLYHMLLGRVCIVPLIIFINPVQLYSV